MKQILLVKLTGKSKATISRVVNGKSRPSWELAEQLEQITGIDASRWMRMQVTKSDLKAVRVPTDGRA